jgi:hypothetical protein
MFNRRPFELPKASYGLKGRARRYRCTLSCRTRGNPLTTRARNQIVVDSVDSAGRGRDMVSYVDPRDAGREGRRGPTDLKVCRRDRLNRSRPFCLAQRASDDLHPTFGIKEPRPRGQATIGADTPIKTDYAFDPLPRSGRSPTLV